jgi:uncharacterized membrane protein
MGAIGGFVAPLLCSSGNGDHVTLFTYYAILNAEIFAIAWFKAWRSLNLIGFVFTFVVATAWGALRYQPRHFDTTKPFLILFFLFFVDISVLYALRQPPRLKGLIDSTLIFGVPLVCFGLQIHLVKGFEFGLTYSSLALGSLYVVLATVLWRMAIPQLPSPTRGQHRSHRCVSSVRSHIRNCRQARVLAQRGDVALPGAHLVSSHRCLQLWR